MFAVNQRGYLVASAVYYPALTLLLVVGAWALGKPYDGRAVVGFLVVTSVAGVAVARLLRRQLLLARGAKVVLVGILALVLGTPIVVIPDLLFGFSGLHGPLAAPEAVLALLVAVLAISLNPVFWAVSSGYVVLLRKAAERPGPASVPRPDHSPGLTPGGGAGR
jgi:hypothetical protein